jgi:isopenicillin N synthase-like dioxygenase
MNQTSDIPIVDVSPLTESTSSADAVATAIRNACCESGFFYVTGHGVSDTLQRRLEDLSSQFFALDQARKDDIRMERGGRAWRGYFRVGEELTSGRPDRKEGLYFGAELSDDHPKVVAGVPLHGRNLFPDIPLLRETVLEYMDAMTRLGHTLMAGIALSLGLDASYFRDDLTADPLILFRIFHYPPQVSASESTDEWGVSEHTDYGLLTILRQDECGGLQVKSRSRWVDAVPIPDAFVCNIGDMLDRMTAGLYRSTPHRVRNVSGRGRLSFPFFFDPGFDAIIRPVPTNHAASLDADSRWDDQNIHEFEGTYGDYVLAKVSKVFPDLGGNAL